MGAVARSVADHDRAVSGKGSGVEIETGCSGGGSDWSMEGWGVEGEEGEK